jgi:hypothetical protein
MTRTDDRINRRIALVQLTAATMLAGPELLRNWPPFLGIRFHERGECLRRLPLA